MMQADRQGGLFVGYGLVMGAALGVVFMPIYGAVAIGMGTGLGLLIGAVLDSAAKQRRR